MIVDVDLVLVVEDEVLIRMSLVEDLEDAGLIVLEAGSADEALKLLDENPRVGTLFTDVNMPGAISGLDLARLVSQSRPDISIVISSGYLRMPKDELPGNVSFISKPYDIERVVKQIRGLARL
jgi:CheY-like chemotaxis protein